MDSTQKHTHIYRHTDTHTCRDIKISTYIQEKWLIL